MVTADWGRVSLCDIESKFDTTGLTIDDLFGIVDDMSNGMMHSYWDILHDACLEYGLTEVLEEEEND